MTEQILASLLEEVKSNLQITWDDEETNKSLQGIIKRAEAYLLNLTSAPSFDFSKDDDPKSLLLERCRYVYNNSADEFETNYQSELNRLILRVALDIRKTEVKTDGQI